MRWLTNIHDPSKPDAYLHIYVEDGQTIQQAIDDWEIYLSNKIIGRPKASDAYTVEQLEAMDMVGVYVND